MLTPRAMFRILSITSLLARKALRLIIHVELFCMLCIIPIEIQLFE